MNLAFLVHEFSGGAGTYATGDFKQHLFKLKTELKLGDLDANKSNIRFSMAGIQES